MSSRSRMRAHLCHSIISNPRPEDAGTVIVNAVVFGYDSSFTDSSLIEVFIDRENNDCSCKQGLDYFLMESGIHYDDNWDALIDIFRYVSDVTCSESFTNSPGCALQVWLRVLPDDLQTEEEPIEEVSFNETNYIPSRPASKQVVVSLPRNLYHKINSTGEKCTICLEDFKNGGKLVTLPCQHQFDEDCAVKWFETGHFCPLCRFQLPSEDQ